MIHNRFVVICTAYNKEKYVPYNIFSVKQQSYGNFIALYGYDKSTDNTRQVILDNIKNDDRFMLFDNPTQESQLTNYFACIQYLKDNNLLHPEDIIMEVDADDWLLHAFVFQYLNDVYQNPNVWMTYGQYIAYPNGEVGNHYYMKLEDDVDKHNAYRQALFPYSHLKTYKAWLLDKVPTEYVINPETGKYFSMTADFALCMPMVEMAGKEHIHRVDEPIYVYNVADDANNESSRVHEQKRLEAIIRGFTPCERLKEKPV
jgi:glycosyltransferase involved in cell wall biosynthesis